MTRHDHAQHEHHAVTAGEREGRGDGHTATDARQAHGGHTGHDKHAGHDPEMFRAPRMMLLISMAITVAYVASAATSVGLFDLDFWWELAALVTIMLLGHWQELKAIGQAQGALAALAALLPDDAERVTDGGVEHVSVADLRVGDVLLVRPGCPRRRRGGRGGPRLPARRRRGVR